MLNHCISLRVLAVVGGVAAAVVSSGVSQTLRGSGDDGSYQWVLSFAKQYGQYVSGLAGGQAELFCFDGVTGTPNGSTLLTNKYNNNSGIFGHGDASGDLRVTFDLSNKEYDFHVYDPGASVPSESTPDFFWEGPAFPHSEDYRMEAHFLRVPTGAVKTNPFQPVYNYDLITGFNSPTQQVAGFTSDAFVLTDWASYQAQTFVVPDGVNRIVAAKAFCVRDINHPRSR